MLRYMKTIRQFKNGCDTFPLPSESTKAVETRLWTYSVHRSVRIAVRIAVCTGLAAAFVFTGVFGLPLLEKKVGGSKPSHDFVLTVQAADTKTTLKDNVNIKVPSGGLTFDASIFKNGKELQSSSLGEHYFLCTGENIKSVLYTAKSGKIQYSSDETRARCTQAIRDATVCTIILPNDILYDPNNPGRDLFTTLWNSGKLEEYRNKYFGGKQIDDTRYRIYKENVNSSSAGGGNGGFIGGMPNNTPKDPDMTAITIADTWNKEASISEVILDSAIKTDASDHNAKLIWYPPQPAFKTAVESADEIRRSTGKKDYFSVPGDTITVTAVFTDGQTVIKHIILTFDKDGNLCADLQDN
jgi:hypothetical protein